MANSLSSSVNSLQSSLQLLDSSISTLDSGINDFPRMCKVLQTTRVSVLIIMIRKQTQYTDVVILQHFELLPEPTLREAQQSLLDEITPSIAHLLSLASNHVEKLSRREQGLRAKCELQEGRLYSNENRATTSRSQSSASGDRQRGSAAGKAAELRRLVQKRERLQYAVERLELQSKQRERQLRKSMAAQ
jgi:DASH complex subunit SPC19